MRSPRAAVGALALLLGVPIAFASAIILGQGAELIIHVALCVSFLMLAWSAFDFKMPVWIAAIACLAIGVLGIVFALQAASEALRSEELRHLAYDVLGQQLEKVLGYAFLLWCIALLCLASTGATRIFGAVTLAIALGVEIYSFVTINAGGQPSEALKLLHLPVFVWLLLEGLKRTATRAASPS